MADYLNKHNVRLVSGGTDTHLILVDLRSLNITGIEAEDALYSVGITVNRNRIPYDPEPPTIASGIRIGTAAITSTGFIEEDIDEISDIHVNEGTIISFLFLFKTRWANAIRQIP